jgi:ElaB/YqjD/DUF883 family membrane-anchored ribosome-binding protein
MRKNTLKMLLCFGALTTAMALSSYAVESKTNADIVAEKARASVEQIKIYSIDKKDDATEKAKEIMASLDSHIKTLDDAITDKKSDMTDATREAKGKTLAQLRQQRHDVQNWYDKFKDSSQDVWDEVKHGFIKAYDAFQDTYKGS